VLVGLEGRPPVRFRSAAGDWLNNIEVTHVLQRFAIPQFTLHQDGNGSLLLRLSGAGIPAAAIHRGMIELFGADQPLAVEFDARFDDKVVQYTSDLAGAQP
jgi:phenylacetate-CoA ligase